MVIFHISTVNLGMTRHQVLTSLTSYVAAVHGGALPDVHSTTPFDANSACVAKHHCGVHALLSITSPPKIYHHHSCCWNSRKLHSTKSRSITNLHSIVFSVVAVGRGIIRMGFYIHCMYSILSLLYVYTLQNSNHSNLIT